MRGRESHRASMARNTPEPFCFPSPGRGRVPEACPPAHQYSLVSERDTLVMDIQGGGGIDLACMCAPSPAAHLVVSQALRDPAATPTLTRPDALEGSQRPGDEDGNG